MTLNLDFFYKLDEVALLVADPPQKNSTHLRFTTICQSNYRSYSVNASGRRDKPEKIRIGVTTRPLFYDLGETCLGPVPVMVGYYIFSSI